MTISPLYDRYTYKGNIIFALPSEIHSRVQKVKGFRVESRVRNFSFDNTTRRTENPQFLIYGTLQFAVFEFINWRFQL